MKKNFLLVYHNKTSDKIVYKYFETLEDMKDYIKINIRQKRYFKILGKYKIKEV